MGWVRVGFAVAVEGHIQIEHPSLAGWLELQAGRNVSSLAPLVDKYVRHNDTHW